MYSAILYLSLQPNFVFKCELFSDSAGGKRIHFSEHTKAATEHHYPYDGRMFLSSFQHGDVSTKSGCR